MTDKKEGRKNFPLTFNTELNTEDKVTNIKKGKVIINSWFANKNWISLFKKPGANNETACSLKKYTKIDRNNVITKKKLNIIYYKTLCVTR